MINQTIATAAFNKFGLEAMGIASGQLAAQWADAAPTYDRPAMTLTLGASNNWKAMTGGMVLWSAFGAKYLSDAAGNALTGTVGVFVIHPQAALRLRRLIGSRFDGVTTGLATRPVPFYIALKDGAPGDIQTLLTGTVESDPPLAPINASVGTSIGHGTLTIHDEQGLIIDPAAVAALFKDLMQAFPALRNDDGGSEDNLTDTSKVGGIASIAAMGTARRLHLVDPFGNAWSPTSTGVGLLFGTGSRLSANLVDWPDAQALKLTGTDPDLRFGLSPEGKLASTDLNPPAFPSTVFPSGGNQPQLSTQFFRVVVVHLSHHLTGNRTTAALDNVPGVDDGTSHDIAPLVREGDQVDFLLDGQATLGAVNEVIKGGGFSLAVSPTISGDGALPNTHTDRWPDFPAATGTAASLDATTSKQAKTACTAAYAGSTADVVVSWPQGSLPAEAFIRVFPRVDPGPAVVPLAELDFSKRGDGASTIVKAGAATIVLLKDPFKAAANPRPTTPQLRFDLLIVTRDSGVKGRLLGGIELSLGADTAAPAIPAVTNALNNLPANQKGISPAPVIGLTPTAPAPDANPVLSALGEAAPREAPRFRTMARLDSMAANNDGGSPGKWTSVLTAGLLTAQSVRGDARLGNPGNPAGPEDYVPGVKVSGRLATDIARFALRRTHHLSVRLAELNNNDRWKLPDAGTGNFAGALLQNIADIVESPELNFVPDNIVQNLPNDWNGLINTIKSFLPSSLSSISSSVPTPDAGTRWVEEVKRDATASKFGRRDSQWALRWAIAHARTLIYIETPLFAPTAAGTEKHEVDLVQALKDRLAAAPNLRLVIATPKRVNFGPGYESFAERFYLARNTAIASLSAVAPKRVIVYHPVGFPGRTEVIRGTLAVIDDVWALLGSSAFSRRGLTFDGSLDLNFLDKTVSGGASKGLRDLRKQAMARTLGLKAPASGETAHANWVRLSQATKAFELVREIVERGGDGLAEPLWPGLPESQLPALDQKIADPDGRGFSAILGLFVSVLSGLGQSKV